MEETRKGKQKTKKETNYLNGGKWGATRERKRGQGMNKRGK